METLFVYGNLKRKDNQKAYIGKEKRTTPDTLLNYTTRPWHMGMTNYPVAFIKKGEKVDGLVMKVTKHELDNLDIYETDNYARKKLQLASGTIAWVYVENHKH